MMTRFGTMAASLGRTLRMTSKPAMVRISGRRLTMENAMISFLRNDIKSLRFCMDYNIGDPATL